LKNLLFTFLFLITICASGQNKDGVARLVKQLGKAKKASGISAQKEDPESRTAFDRSRLQDPNTGQLPTGIKALESEFFDRTLRRDMSQFRTLDNLVKWGNRGPFNVGGRTRALAIDISNEKILLAGGASGGIWRSENGGDTWKKTTGSNELQSVTAIAQDPRVGHTDTWYYATGEWSGNSAAAFGADYSGDGIFKSTDGGKSWSILPSTVTAIPQSTDQDFDFNHEIAVSPVDGTVAVANFGGIYISNDEGTSWKRTQATSASGWTDVVVTETGIFYAFIRQLGVVRSADSGATWTDISSPSFPIFASFHRGELAVAPSNENVVYFLAEANGTTSGHALWKYDASNNSWINRTSNIPQTGGSTGDFDSQGGYDLLIKVKPDDENMVFIGGTNLYRSTNGFATIGETTWIGGYTAENDSYAVYGNHHPDQHCLVFYPSDPKKAISGNDGGLQLCDDITANDTDIRPVIWKPINNGYLTTQAYAVAVGPKDLIVAGFQDNGSWMALSDDPQEDWSDPYSGDGGYSAISSDGKQRYYSSQNADVIRFDYANAATINADKAEAFSPDNLSSPLFISPLYIDPLDDNIVYLGGTTALNVNTRAKTGTSTSGWKTISLSGTSGKVAEMAVIGNGSLYVGTSGGKLFKITGARNTNPVVKNISNAVFASRFISGIAVNPSNADELIVCVSNYSVQSIFHSTNGGTTWTHVSGNLEENSNGTGNGPSVRCVQILGDGQLYLVGTSVGLFSTKTLDGDNTVWEQENLNELGSLVVEHMAVRQSDGLVVVGTHGNGVFSARFPLFQKDLSIESLVAPRSSVLGVDEPLTVAITNLATETATSFSIKYSVDGIERQNSSITASIASGETYEHTFSKTFDFSTEGKYTLTFEVQFVGDENILNDVLSEEISSYRYVNKFPFESNFEKGAEGWSADALWELGRPQKSILDRASMGLSAWATDLTDNYPSYTTAKLLSPVFDFSTLNFPVVSFDLAYVTEAEWDGMVLAYSTDLNNRNFKVIEDASGVTNWYDAYTDVFGYKAWTGTQADFVNASADLKFLAGEPQVQFAFIFQSDALENDEGFVIDHFHVFDDLTLDNQILLSKKSILENGLSNAVVGQLSTELSSEVITYSLDIGIGDTDNAAFLISGDSLMEKSSFNFEVKSRYVIRVKGVDQSLNVYTSVFYVTVLDANDPLIGLELSKMNIDENSPIGSSVGFLAAKDEDLYERYAFSLVAGKGDADNASFGILNNELRSSKKFDFETKSIYSVRLQAKSANTGDTITASFAISILNANDAPTALVLSNNKIPDFEPAGYNIGALSASDVDGDQLSFSLVTGTGDDDNPRFVISGTDLITEEGADFSVQPKYRIRVEASDGQGGFLVSPFEISVQELLGLLELGKMGVSISPNPTAKDVNIKIGNKSTGNAAIVISTIEGKELYRHSFLKEEFLYKSTLDLSGIAKGVYFIKVEIGDRCATGRLVKR
jgi:hypothetical protein